MQVMKGQMPMLRKSSFTIVCFLSIFSLLVGCTQKSEVQSVNTEQSVGTAEANAKEEHFNRR